MLRDTHSHQTGCRKAVQVSWPMLIKTHTNANALLRIMWIFIGYAISTKLEYGWMYGLVSVYAVQLILMAAAGTLIIVIIAITGLWLYLALLCFWRRISEFYFAQSVVYHLNLFSSCCWDHVVGGKLMEAESCSTFARNAKLRNGERRIIIMLMDDVKWSHFSLHLFQLGNDGDVKYKLQESNREYAWLWWGRCVLAKFLYAFLNEALETVCIIKEHEIMLINAIKARWAGGPFSK